MEINPANSRVRTLITIAVPEPPLVLQRLEDLASSGKVVSSFEREWENGHYRFGGDWLSGAAFELINTGGTPLLRQFELSGQDGWTDLPFEAVAFAPRARGGQPEPSPTPVTIHRAGVVYSESPITLLWVEWGLQSPDPARWLDFAGALRQMLPEGGKDDYQRHFMRGDGTALSATGLIRAALSFLLGPEAAGQAWCGREITLCARLNVLSENPDEAGPFVAALLREDRAGQQVSAGPTGRGQADIRTAWSTSGMATLLLRAPGAPAGRGSPAFGNAFNLTDLWLAQVVCLLQRQILARLDHELVSLVGQLRLTRGGLFRPSALRVLFRVKTRYEQAMDSFMESYWRFGLLQLHTQSRRHSVYLGLRDALRLEKSAEEFRHKLETLGTYLGEKQKTLLGWFLIYVPFLSLIVGGLGINVRGYTSADGLTLAELGLVFGLFSLGYISLIAGSTFLIQRRVRRSLEP